MKIYKVKAIVYTTIGILHIVFLRKLPNPALAAVIAVGCFGLGIINISKWVENE